MKLDFSPLKGQIDHLAIQLAIVLFVPLLIGLIAKLILRKFRVPNIIVNYGSILVLLYVFYKTIMIVL